MVQFASLALLSQHPAVELQMHRTASGELCLAIAHCQLGVYSPGLQNSPVGMDPHKNEAWWKIKERKYLIFQIFLQVSAIFLSDLLIDLLRYILLYL